MPVFNGGPFFAAALGSAVAQDYDNLEIIVVDDGSTDGLTVEIAQTFVRAHPGKVRYLRQDNGGVAAALNTGIAAATGEFFAWLSHDDLYTAQFVSSQVRFFESLGVPDACLYANYSLIDAESNVFARSVLDVTLYRANPELGLLHSGINGCTVLIPMAVLKQYLPFDPRLCHTQDYDLWGRLLERHPFILNDADLVHYRMHDAQGTRERAATEEGNRLWIRLMEGQDELRRAQIFGSRSNFYAQMARFLARTPYAEAAAYAERMAAASPAATRISIAMWVGDDLSAAQQTYASILAQTHQNWELWLLAPHWTATTEALNNTIVDRSRITWIVADIGEAELGNRVLDVSRGDYFAFARSGDWLAPDRLADQLAAMQQAGAAVSHGGYFVALAGLSSRRAVRRFDPALGSGRAGDLSPIDVALPTVMAHRIVVANGLRFDPRASDPGALFLAWLGLLHEWLYLDAPIAEVSLAPDSPLLSPAARQGLETELSELISTADRTFSAAAFGPDQARARATADELWTGLNEGCIAGFADDDQPAGSGPTELGPRPARACSGGRILIVTHAWGGGTDRFARQQILGHSRAGREVLVLSGIDADGMARLHAVNAYGGIRQTVDLRLENPDDELAGDLAALGIERIAINALVSVPPNCWVALKRAADHAGIPYDVHLHDYSYVCPRLHLTLPDGRYCGAPVLTTCERCIAVHGGLVPSQGVNAWRTQHGWLLSGARRIVAPHADVSRRYQDYFPGLAIEVVPHSEEPLPIVRVAVMGHCGIHKGANTFVEVARRAQHQGYPIEFVMIGSCDRADDLARLDNVQLLGAYREGTLERLLAEVQPDIAWFPGQAAETFSYTLSTAFTVGLVPVAFDVGAIAQRIAERGTGVVLPLRLADDPDAVCQGLLEVGLAGMAGRKALAECA